MHSVDASDFSEAESEVVTRALKHKKERMTTRTSKINVTALCQPGLKSHCVGLILRKENGKCDAAKHHAELLYR
jgi:hypothetical protein